jgi:hypothetical protein
MQVGPSARFRLAETGLQISSFFNLDSSRSLEANRFGASYTSSERKPLLIAQLLLGAVRIPLE